MASKSTPPWKRPNPRKRVGKASITPTSAQKLAARDRARRAGRRYPNMVDNMNVAKAAEKTSHRRQ